MTSGQEHGLRTCTTGGRVNGSAADFFKGRQK